MKKILVVVGIVGWMSAWLCCFAGSLGYPESLLELVGKDNWFLLGMIILFLPGAVIWVRLIVSMIFEDYEKEGKEIAETWEETARIWRGVTKNLERMTDQVRRWGEK